MHKPAWTGRAVDGGALATLALLLVNTSVVGIPSVFDQLPWYLGGALIFALPIGLMVALSLLLGAVAPAFAARTSAVEVLGITAVVVWLPTVAPGLFWVKDAIQLNTGEVVRATHPDALTTRPDAAFATFHRATLRADLAGSITTRRTARHTGQTRHTTHVAPVVTATWAQDQPVSVWAISDAQHPPFSDWVKRRRPLQGMIRHEHREYLPAIARAARQHSVRPAREVVLISLCDSFETRRARQTQRALLAVLLLNLFWGGGVFLWTWNVWDRSRVS